MDPHAELMARHKERLNSLGYDLDMRRDGYFVSRLDDSPWERRFKEGMGSFIGALDHSTMWRLDLEYGRVDFDRETLMVHPRDGSEPYTTKHVFILGWGGDKPLGETAAKATELFMFAPMLAERHQLSLGGAWHKWV